MRSILIIHDKKNGGWNPFLENLQSFYNLAYAESKKEALSFLERMEADLIILDSPLWKELSRELIGLLEDKAGEMGIVIIGEGNDIRDIPNDSKFRFVDYVSNSADHSRLLAAINGAMEKIAFVERVNFISDEIKRLKATKEGQIFPNFAPWIRLFFSDPVKKIFSGNEADYRMRNTRKDKEG